MTITEARVMAAVKQHGPQSIAEVAANTGLSPRSVRGAVDELAYRGWLRRSGDHWDFTENGRAYINTPRGRNALDVPPLKAQAR
ncbi:MarR family protein [Nocardia amikacinitolerans]|uniref:MarR family protein n=1 Tax=Nocardia amikacinitolerans TaxID=756689 RepID=A0A285LHB0_9NOCA|nr:MarR family transcriptional regulator [Nocardia amikacinitolerans]SNY83843.1 MarR family protein [Nocardia amikacinitolerans]